MIICALSDVKGMNLNMNKNINIKKLMDITELFEKIQELSKYYNKETINYLYSLLFCSESVFNRLDFANHFSELSLFYELAKYNIWNKAIIQLSKLMYDQIKYLNFNEHDKGFRISYQDKFPVFEFKTERERALTGEEIGPIITIYSATASLEDRMENIKKQIRNLQSFDDSNYIGKYSEKEKAMYQSMFGSYSSKKLYFYKHRIEELGNKIEFLKRYGNIQKDICKLVGDILLEDWNIIFDDDVYLKSLSWIDIYKKKV